MRSLALSIVLFALLVARPARSQPEHEVTDCGLEPPGTVSWPAVPPKPNELPFSFGEAPVVSREARDGVLRNLGSPNARLRGGALSGKVVYVSAGHGFYYSPTLGRWATQRGNTFSVVEDLVSTETTSQFLIPMLLNAGAYVVPLRESDLNTALSITDNGSADYSESGDAAAFSNSSLTGFGALPSPLPNGTNPFELGNNRLMEAVVSATHTASATWVLNVPADGHYNLYVSYTQFSYRVPDAHFAVRHAGGESHFRINQRRHGKTWVLLGRFFFRAGKSAARGALVAFNDASVAGNVSLDAVRIGGGMGLSSSSDGGGASAVSARPRFEEAARYSTQFLGAPASTYDSSTLDDRQDDVSARSRFTAWDHEAGEDAVYVAWHTNACGTTTCTARGTNTYVYGPNPPDGTYNFTGTAGSDVLAQHVHAELIRDLRSGWDPVVNDGTTWTDKGIKSAYFGEVNPSSNPETPAILLEVAFHNNAVDSVSLKEPYFRYVAARAIAQGIIKYFAQKDGRTAALPPEPPPSVWARHEGSGAVRLSWVAAPTDSQDLAGGAATGFRVYQSADGFAWDDGVDVGGGAHVVNLAPEELRYFRVSATNAGGESFPSETVGVRVPASGGSTVALVVNGFGRFDATLGRAQNMGTWGLGSVLRIFVERMNDGSYVRRHGFALAQSSVPFDSASAAAVGGGQVPLAPYGLVDWFAGRGASSSRALTAAGLQRLRAYVEGGGRLILSGTGIATALAAGGATDQQFLTQILGATSTATAGTSSVDGVPGMALDGLAGMLLDDGLRGTYPVGPTEVLGQGTGTTIAYWAGTTNPAAVRTDGTGKVAFLAFPFEALRSETRRVQVMERLLASLEVSVDPLPYDGGVDELDAGVEEEDAGTGPSDAGAQADAGTPIPDAGTPPPPPPPFVLATSTGEELSWEEAGGCGCSGGGGAAAVAASALPLLLAFVGRRRKLR